MRAGDPPDPGGGPPDGLGRLCRRPPVAGCRPGLATRTLGDRRGALAPRPDLVPAAAHRPRHGDGLRPHRGCCRHRGGRGRGRRPAGHGPDRDRLRPTGRERRGLGRRPRHHRLDPVPAGVDAARQHGPGGTAGRRGGGGRPPQSPGEGPRGLPRPGHRRAEPAREHGEVARRPGPTRHRPAWHLQRPVLPVGPLGHRRRRLRRFRPRPRPAPVAAHEGRPRRRCRRPRHRGGRQPGAARRALAHRRRSPDWPFGWAWFAVCSVAFGGRLLRFGAPVEAAEAPTTTTPAPAGPPGQA